MIVDGHKAQGFCKRQQVTAASSFPWLFQAAGAQNV